MQYQTKAISKHFNFNIKESVQSTSISKSLCLVVVGTEHRMEGKTRLVVVGTGIESLCSRWNRTSHGRPRYRITLSPIGVSLICSGTNLSLQLNAPLNLKIASDSKLNRCPEPEALSPNPQKVTSVELQLSAFSFTYLTLSAFSFTYLLYPLARAAFSWL